MAFTAAELTKDGELKIAGSINERLPVITDGLVAHFPFDGTLNHYRDFNGIKVLGYNGGSASYPWMNYLESLGASITAVDTATFESMTGEQAKVYDFVVVDRYVWGITSTQMDKIKEFVDAGVSVLAIGNDTRTNVFVKSYDTSTGQAAHDLIVESSIPIDVDSEVFYDADPDVFGGITELQNGAYPVYRRADTGYIMGYIYESFSSDAALFFTQSVKDGDGACVRILEFAKSFIKYVLGRSRGGITNINTTLTYDGIAMDEGTTNVVNNPDGKTLGGYTVPGSYQPGWDAANHPEAITVANWSGGYNAGVASPEIGYHAHWIYGGKDGLDDPCMFFRDENYKWGLGHRWLGISQYLGIPASLGWAVGDKITISWWQKSSVPNKGARVGLYHMRIAEGTNGFEDNIQIVYVTKVGEWERAYFTTTIGSNWDLNSNVYLYVYGHYGDYGCLWVDDIQVEKKAYPTSFVNGSREGVSRLELPTSLLNPTEGTINFKMIFYHASDWTRVVGAGVYSNPITTDEFLLLFDNTDDIVNGYRDLYFAIRSKDSASSVSLTADAARLNIGEEYNITVTWSETEGKIKLYIGGLFKQEAVVPAGFIFPDYDSYNTIDIGDYTYSSKSINIKDLSFYSRALTDDEIKKLANADFTDFELQPTGDLIVPKIEVKLSLPSDVYYFPLGADTKDQFKYLGAVSEANLVFEEGKVWVGTTTENLIETIGAASQDWTKWSHWGSGYWGQYEQYYDGDFGWVFKGTKDGASSTATYIYDYYPYTFNIGDKLTFSCFMRVNKDITKSITFYVVDSDGGQHGISSGGGQTITFKANEWQLIVWNNEIIEDALSTGGFGLSMGTGWEGCIVEIAKPQLEKKNFYSPFVNGIRDQSDLEFNLHETIGLNWNEDWTIIYWKTPIGTHNNLLTGYNLESFGCNSNSVGGGYRWWGKRSGYNTIYVSNTGDLHTFTPSNYFNKEHMVSIVKSGNNVTWKFWDIEGQVILATQTWGTITSNYFVTQYGYDLKLGGWDNTYACNTYFRDLIVAKRALTDDEINAIRIHSLEKLNDSSLRILKNISTGQML